MNQTPSTFNWGDIALSQVVYIEAHSVPLKLRGTDGKSVPNIAFIGKNANQLNLIEN